MQYDIQPKYEKIKVTCSCGNTFETRSAGCRDLQTDICSKCHPFFTGQQKMIDTGGRLERFNAKYNRKKKSSESSEA